jgi:putative transposase
VFVERIWRSVKYERVYLKEYKCVTSARADIADYFAWYSSQRPHSILERITLDQAYLNSLPKLAKTA